MKVKQYYNVYHIYEIFEGSRISRVQKHVGLLEATKEEIDDFMAKWNKPRVYFHTGDRLYEHMVVAVPVKKAEINKLQPYDPETRDWPDLPEGYDFALKWNKETQKWE